MTSSDKGHGLHLTVEGRNFAVTPGTVATVQMKVRNSGKFVEHVDTTVRGLPADWFTVLPTDLNLDTGKERPVSIRLHPPKRPSTAPGRHTLDIIVSSTSNPKVRCETAATLDVATFIAMTMQIEPSAYEGKRLGRWRVAVTNGGNRSLTAAVRASDQSGKLRFRSDPAEVEIAPGATDHVTILGTAQPLLISGRPARRQMTITAQAEGQTPATTTAAVTQEPLVPRWVMRTVAVVVALVALVAVLKMATSHKPPLPSPVNHVKSYGHTVAPPGLDSRIEAFAGVLD